jgi:hypothetical protein
MMALFARGKKELLVGPQPGKFHKHPWLRWLKVGVISSAVLGLIGLGIRSELYDSRRRVALLEMEAIASAARVFRVDFGRCPHDMRELSHPPAGGTPYLASRSHDPWGGSYFLQCPGRWDVRNIDVATPGPDGQWLGGDDLSTDL